MLRHLPAVVGEELHHAGVGTIVHAVTASEDDE